MNRIATNALIACACAVLFAALTWMSGLTTLNNGLGTDGPVLEAMAIHHDRGAGSAIDKLTPAFPATVAIAYAITGQVLASFIVANVLSILMLATGACLLLDTSRAPPLLKACVAATLVIGMPARAVAFMPAQPALFAVALTTLAVYACERWPLALAAILHVGAAIASPAGIIAPVYGIGRSLRVCGTPRERWTWIASVPALVAWLAVQTLARGGPSGLADLVRVTRVRADAAFLFDSVFLLFVAYGIITAVGGFTILVWSNPRWIRLRLSEHPELWGLVLPAVPFIVTAGTDMPRMLPFLIPFWVLLIGLWGRDHARSLTTGVVIAMVMTLVVDAPWSRITDARYFVDWFPFAVYAQRVASAVNDVEFAAIWKVRMLAVAAAVAVGIAWDRYTAAAAARRA